MKILSIHKIKNS